VVYQSQCPLWFRSLITFGRLAKTWLIVDAASLKTFDVFRGHWCVRRWSFFSYQFSQVAVEQADDVLQGPHASGNPGGHRRRSTEPLLHAASASSLVPLDDSDEPGREPKSESSAHESNDDRHAVSMARGPLRQSN
jgi:hypothetical protein